MSTRKVRLSLTVHNGHLIVSINGRTALIDTGCPVTLGVGKAFEIADKSTPLHEDFFGITVDSIAEPVGYPLDLVIGMDVLRHFSVRLSIASAQIVLGDKCGEAGETLEVGSWFGAPTVPIVVKGKPVEVIFDTGAPTSYLSASLIKGYEFVEKRTDFYPLKGTFEVDVFKVPVKVGSLEKDLEIAAMEGVMAHMLESNGMPGILGSELLRYTDVTLTMAKDAITLTELAA